MRVFYNDLRTETINDFLLFTVTFYNDLRTETKNESTEHFREKNDESFSQIKGLRIIG